MSESFPKTQNIRSECLQPVLISNELGVIDKTKKKKKKQKNCIHSAEVAKVGFSIVLNLYGQYLIAIDVIALHLGVKLFMKFIYISICIDIFMTFSFIFRLQIALKK